MKRSHRTGLVRFLPWLGLALPWLGLAFIGLFPLAASANTIGQGGIVAVCDPKYPDNCTAPSSSGASSQNLTEINGQAVLTGHGTASTALRVELPTDGTGVVNAKQSGVWTIGTISGPVALPTGASTSALQPGFGVAGTPQTNVLTVQGISGGTNVNVNCATGCSATSTATASTYDLTNGAYATGPVGAQALTSPPTLTTGKIYTLNQNLAGGLRVDGSAVTQPISGTVSASQSGTWDIRNITGTVTLPTGAATAALQTTGNTALSTINTTLGSPFQAGGSIGNTTFGATQSGTWTVNPGNIANTTAWKVDGSGVTQPVSLSGNQAVNVAQVAGVATATGNGVVGTGVQRVTIASDSTGQLALAAGANLVGNVGQVATATGGMSVASALVPNNTTGVIVKASAGQAYTLQVFNNSGTPAYVRLYNKTTAPTCGTDTPVARYMVPGNATGGAGFVVQWDVGLAFTTGIGYCITTGIADTDTTAPAANTYLVNVGYK